MTTSVPAHLTVPLLIWMVVVVAARYLWFHAKLTETYLNNTLALMVGANLLREGSIQEFLADAGVLTVTTSQQFSLALLIFAAAEFMSFVNVWTKGPDEQPFSPYNAYRASAVGLVILFLVAGSPARAAGLPLEVHGGWCSVLAWGALTAMFIALSARLIWMSYVEITNPEAKRRERVVSFIGLGLGVAIGTTLALMMSVAALSLPEMLILRKVIKWQALALFASILAVAFTLVGWTFNLMS